MAIHVPLARKRPSRSAPRSSAALLALFLASGCAAILGIDNEYVDDADTDDAPGPSSGSPPASSAANGSGGNGDAGASGAGGEFSFCGNGKADPGETCDDGNTVPADGCSPQCTIEMPDACPGARVPLGAGAITIQGDLTQAAKNTEGSCGGGASGDLIYELVSKKSGTLTATMAGAFGKRLYARRACDNSSSANELWCGASEGAVGVSLWVQAGDPIYLIADGTSAGAGAFTLSLALTECGDSVVQGLEQCDDGNAIDGDGCAGCIACEGANEFQDPASHHCYRSVTDSSTWSAARSSCIAWGGDLAALSSDSERLFVGTALAMNAWIGGSDEALESSFVWTNGEPWFDAWSDGEPNDNGILGEDCIQLSGSEDLFNDYACNTSLPYVCERAPTEP